MHGLENPGKSEPRRCENDKSKIPALWDHEKHSQAARGVCSTDPTTRKHLQDSKAFKPLPPMITACLRTCSGTASPFSEGLQASGPFSSLLLVVKIHSQALSFCASPHGQVWAQQQVPQHVHPADTPRVQLWPQGDTPAHNPRLTEQAHQCWGQSEGNQNSQTGTPSGFVLGRKEVSLT